MGHTLYPRHILLVLISLFNALLIYKSYEKDIISANYNRIGHRIL